MLQMYKVFVNNKPIILTDDVNISSEFKKVDYHQIDVLEIIDSLNKITSNGIILIDSDLKKMWKSFKKNFKIEKAAGGKVINSKEEVLFIYRLNKWDLPKGKLEKGESLKECAIREVEEECGITSLIIDKKLQTTYHIFERNHKLILKITYWFLMKSTFSGKLIPQVEEGIEEVVFKNEDETGLALKNTYENIKLLF